MLRHGLLIILFCSSLCYAKSQSLEDLARRKFTDRIASAISKNCNLSDSAKQKLSNVFYEHIVEIKKIRNANADKLICVQKLRELRMEFENDLKQNFGNDAYKCYKKITTSTPTFPRTKMPNRITERTSE